MKNMITKKKTVAKTKKTKRIAQMRSVRVRKQKPRVASKRPKSRMTSQRKVLKKKIAARAPRRQARPVSRRKQTRINRTQSSMQGITQVKVIGIGGAGGNIISRMREKNRMRGVEYIAVNTDAQDLDQVSVHRKIYIGRALTKGLGAGMNPDIGRQAAEENRSEIGEMLDGADIVFVVGGFGGGTASGAAPIVAEIAKQKGILTIGIVTKPFEFEGSRRMNIAQEALDRMREHVDALVVIPNDRIFALINKDTPIIRAFMYIDDILNHGVQAIGDLINIPGIINIDFADIKTILQDAGPSLIGVGIASGQDRAAKAVDEAIHSPLLETSIEGAKGILFSVAGGRDMKMVEINDIAKVIAANLDSNAKVIFGAYYDRNLKDKQLKVTVIATGFSNLFSSDRLGTQHLFTKRRANVPFPVSKTIHVEKQEKSSSTNEEDASVVESQEPKTDPWDIPAFLRKKKK